MRDVADSEPKRFWPCPQTQSGESPKIGLTESDFGRLSNLQGFSMLCGEHLALAKTMALRDSAIIGPWKFLRVIELQGGLA